MNQTVKLFLRESYAQIIKNGTISSDNTFQKGNIMFHHIKYNKQTITNNDIIAFFHPNIINIYWLNRELLNPKELSELKYYVKQQPTTFKQSGNDYLGGYLSVNEVNDYSIIYVKVEDFIKSIENNEAIISIMPMVDINIFLEYELYDFYKYD